MRRRTATLLTSSGRRCAGDRPMSSLSEAGATAALLRLDLAGEVQVSVEAVLAALDPNGSELLVVMNAADGRHGVDAVIRAERRS
jgi:hypothetical protein